MPLLCKSTQSHTLMFIFVIFIFLRKYTVHSFLFSTKTPYEWVANVESSRLLPSNMRAIYINYLGRHGSRFPSAKDVEIMRNAIEIVQKAPLYHEYFSSLNFEFKEDDDKILSPRGIFQLSQIGQRFRKRLSDIFDQSCSTFRNFRFKSTCRSRSTHSMIAFIDGMFNISENTFQLPEITIHECDKDEILRFFDFCPHYFTKQKCLQKSRLEQHKFIESGYMKGIISKVAKKLELDENALSATDIKAIYLICAYKLSMSSSTINEDVCRLFDQESYHVIDYMLDIRQFYKRGNSDALNIKMSCTLYQNVYHSVARALKECERTCSLDKKGSAHHGGDFNFAHAETLIPLLGSFGFFGGNASNFYELMDKSMHINSENFHLLNQNRLFRGGYFSPMAGNIAFVVGCSDSHDEGFVVALLNENPIEIPCCKGHTIKKEDGIGVIPVCPSKLFAECFEYMALNCNFHEICDEEYECQKNTP